MDKDYDTNSAIGEIRDLVSLLVYRGIMSETEAGELEFALRLFQDYPGRLFTETIPELLRSLRDNQLSNEKASLPLVDIQIGFSTILRALNRLKFLGIMDSTI